MHKSKVLLTGGNGLLGSNIARQLNEEGYKVVVLLRKNSNRLALEGIPIEIIEGDISDIKALEKAIKDCKYVIHCAAKTGQIGLLRDYEQINIEATKLLIELCGTAKIKRFVYISTANCFTNGTIEKPGNEKSTFMYWLKKSGYAYSKFLAQELVLAEAKKNHFPALVLAPTFMIGPGDAKKSSGKLLLHGLNKRFIFYPSGGKSFINVEYAATAVVNSLIKGKIGECYLLAGDNMTYKDFFSIIKQKYNPKAFLIQIPDGLFKLIAVFFSFVQELFQTPLPLNQTNHRLLCLDNYFSGKKAQNQLGLEPTDIEYAIDRAYNWFSVKGYTQQTF